MTARRIYILGTLAAGVYPQHLSVTESAPLATRTHDDLNGVRWVTVPSARGFVWRVARGRVVEFTSPYTGQRAIAREVTDPALVNEVEAAERLVELARRALAVAEDNRALVLASVAARSKPAKVEP